VALLLPLIGGTVPRAVACVLLFRISFGSITRPYMLAEQYGTTAYASLVLQHRAVFDHREGTDSVGSLGSGSGRRIRLGDEDRHRRALGRRIRPACMPSPII
jgi:hypothetical protein